jgi:uncharacterized protein YndB with AHSA1/START domain
MNTAEKFILFRIKSKRWEHMKKGDKPIIVEEIYEAPLKKVWSALTNIEQMRQWYFGNIPDFKPEVGFETQFDVQSETRVFPHQWRVTEVLPPRMITYTWRFDGYQGDSFVVFELFEHKNATKLRLSVQILESFPEDIPEFTSESCIAGWNFFLKERLKEFLEKING